MKSIIKNAITTILYVSTIYIICFSIKQLTTRTTTVERDITQLRAMVQENKQRQLDLITHNDCMACHPQERRCENINGEVWEWEVER